MHKSSLPRPSPIALRGLTDENASPVVRNLSMLELRSPTVRPRALEFSPSDLPATATKRLRDPELTVTPGKPITVEFLRTPLQTISRNEATPVQETPSPVARSEEPQHSPPLTIHTSALDLSFQIRDLDIAGVNFCPSPVASGSRKLKRARSLLSPLPSIPTTDVTSCSFPPLPSAPTASVSASAEYSAATDQLPTRSVSDTSILRRSAPAEDELLQLARTRATQEDDDEDDEDDDDDDDEMSGPCSLPSSSSIPSVLKQPTPVFGPSSLPVQLPGASPLFSAVDLPPHHPPGDDDDEDGIGELILSRTRSEGGSTHRHRQQRHRTWSAADCEMIKERLGSSPPMMMAMQEEEEEEEFALSSVKQEHVIVSREEVSLSLFGSYSSSKSSSSSSLITDGGRSPTRSSRSYKRSYLPSSSSSSSSSTTYYAFSAAVEPAAPLPAAAPFMLSRSASYSFGGPSTSASFSVSSSYSSGGGLMATVMETAGDAAAGDDHHDEAKHRARRITQLQAQAASTLALPIIDKRDEKGVTRIHVDTVAELLQGRYRDKLDNFIIIDCRYDYEFRGGRIRGAVNLGRNRRLVKKFFENNRQAMSCRRVAVIFHCEFSVNRGPKACGYFRKLDRSANSYPDLTFPNLFVMEGGYKQFHERHPELCDPQHSYVSMWHPDYSRDLRRNEAEHRRSWAASPPPSRRFGRARSIAGSPEDVSRSTGALPFRF